MRGYSQMCLAAGGGHLIEKMSTEFHYNLLPFGCKTN